MGGIRDPLCPRFDSLIRPTIPPEETREFSFKVL